MRKDYFNRLNKPTLMQIRYLKELHLLDAKARGNGAVSQIAKQCDVNHAAVSRYLKKCREAGYVDAKNRLTAEGKEWLEYYENLTAAVEEYLKGHGIPQEEIYENMRVMMEEMDDHSLQLILKPHKKKSDKAQAEMPRQKNPFVRIIERGTYPVSFRIFKLVRGTENAIKGLSMADTGFEKPAILKANNRGGYLELTVKEMQQQSKILHSIMAGHVSSLKYTRDGEIISAQIRNGKALIPLDACAYEMRDNGRVTGMIVLTFTCSVGRIHMPESDAMLVFWI